MEGVYKTLKCSCWHIAHCGISCSHEECNCSECDCLNCKPKPESVDIYQVLPEDDGYDTPKNPYSQH